MDAPIRTARLVLSPVEAEDADELAAVFADERLYAFTGGGPGTVEELRGTLGRLARERAGDPWAQRNWVVRRLADRQAVGMLQAAASWSPVRPARPTSTSTSNGSGGGTLGPAAASDLPGTVTASGENGSSVCQGVGVTGLGRVPRARPHAAFPGSVLGPRPAA
jgi:hypothetical protein